MDSCKVCGRKCRNKNLTTIGGQKACSIHCAMNIVPTDSDKCAQCGSPVWINDMYKINGLMCCSVACKNEIEQRTKSLRTKKTDIKKQSDFLDTYQQNDYYNEKEKTSFNDYNNYDSKKSDNKKIQYTNVNVGETNYALGPRDYNTTDYDVGPGTKTGNLYHGDPNFNNYYNDDYEYDEEDEAYGDYDQRNYLREYGEHNYVQINDGKSGDVMKELGMKAHDGKDKPKNEIHQGVHHGNDANCEYCGFSIKDGTTIFIDNFGKIFDTKECFSNHFQGIPKPNFG